MIAGLSLCMIVDFMVFSVLLVDFLGFGCRTSSEVGVLGSGWRIYFVGYGCGCSWVANVLA